MSYCSTCAAPTRLKCNCCNAPYCSAECVHNERPVYLANIEKQTLENDKQMDIIFQESCVPQSRLQIALQSVQTEVGWETHDTLTQFIRVERGTGILYMGNVRHFLRDGTAVVIPAGTPHRIVNSGDMPLKLYAIYAKDSETDGWHH